MGEKEGRAFRNIYKGHRDKTKWGGRIKAGRWGWVGWGGGSVGGKMKSIVLEQQ